MRHRSVYRLIVDSNRPTLVARTQVRNKRYICLISYDPTGPADLPTIRRAEQLAESEPEIRERVKEKHRQAQTRYRESRRALLADKERERRAARQLQVGPSLTCWLFY